MEASPPPSPEADPPSADSPPPPQIANRRPSIVLDEAVPLQHPSPRTTKHKHGAPRFLRGSRSTTLGRNLHHGSSLCLTFCLEKDFNSGGPSHVPPTVANIGEHHIRSMRHSMIFRGRKGPVAEATSNVRVKRLTAGEPLHEPYLVAILIALAQTQWFYLAQERTKQASGVRPKLVYTTDDADFLYLYSTNVSSALLDMFRDPNVTPTARPSLLIQITSIPHRPFVSLRGHIMALLLSATSLEDIAKSEDSVAY
ncbi:hypothetical protein CDD83_6811 [Cordyceps sp. RAO-2017]|nr:hypothetical protein CDD83_6811 [Cordyceps sp. RAO-2017]